MKKKVLLMGKSGSGKSSMRTIIFANNLPQNTMRLGPTLEVSHSHVRFLGNLVLNLWDCGGQDAFMEKYFTRQKKTTFSNVEVLIYVFDIESTEVQKDIAYYRSCIEALHLLSPDAKIFCLIHKMDLVPPSQRQETILKRDAELRQQSLPLKITTFGSSIWDETLYRAWSTIAYALTPNVQVIEKSLKNFCQICESDEVVVFERATFLVISHHTRIEHSDQHRFEKISNIVKQFKLSCNKSMTQFQSMEVRNAQFAAYIDILSSNTYIMVITSNLSITSATMLVNLKAARPHFEKLFAQQK